MYHRLAQDKMKRDIDALQRQLDAKERKLQDLVANTGQVPALKQHYDRVLQDLQSERDSLVSERKQLMDVSDGDDAHIGTCTHDAWRNVVGEWWGGREEGRGRQPA